MPINTSFGEQTFQSVLCFLSIFVKRIILFFFPAIAKMSSTCGNCDCVDKSQCTKKRKAFQVDGILESGFNMRFEYESVSAGENDCNCGPGCTCSTCPCHK